MTSILEVSFFKCSLLIHFGDTESAVEMITEQEIDPSEKADIIAGLYEKPCNGMVTDIGKGRMFVYFGFSHKKINNFHMGIIAHECLHAAHRMLEWVGIQTEDNEELLCMAQQLIFESILDEIKPKKRKNDP